MFELPDEAAPVLGAVVGPNSDDADGLGVAPVWNREPEPEKKPELLLNRLPRGSGLRPCVPPVTGGESSRLPKGLLVVPVLLFVDPVIGDRVPNGPGANKLGPELV